MKNFFWAVAATALTSTMAMAGGHANWASVADEGVVSFGSVKKNVAGEVHHFNNVSGTVSEGGAVAIAIDLTSVETYIDIRNERITEHVFMGAPTATVTGEVDMEDLSDLAIGEVTLADFEGSLSLGGASVDIEAEMLVARLGEDRVLVTTADFIMLSTASMGIDGGIDKLMELAKLPGITRVAPVAIRMVFEK